MVKRLKKGFFEFWCKECDHTWSTHYGTLKFYIAFKKDKDGILKEEKFSLGLLRISSIAKIVMLMPIHVLSNLKVQNSDQNTLVENILIKLVFQLVTRF